MQAPRTRFTATAALAAFAAALSGCDSASSTSPALQSSRPLASVAATGNGAPSGAHFNLNIIGVSHDKAPNFNGGNGGRIFVDLTGSTRIDLTKGDYQVTDADGTDGTAGFQLPDPNDGSGQLAYSVWIRALGNPKGSASMATCFTEFETASTWCNSGDLVVSLKRIAGPTKFVDVSKQLLQVCADVNTDPLVTNLQLVPLFSDLGTDYFWEYDNTGLKLAQMRFYPVSTTAIGGDCTRVAK